MFDYSSGYQGDIDVCRGLLSNGSRTFYLASFALPAALRDAAIALYAFCRVADDDVDIRGGRLALPVLQERLERVYAGRPLASAIDRAFAVVVERHELPRALPEALLEGLRWDVEGRRYDTLSEIFDYAARVAGSVGAMMAVLMGARSEQLLARATELGVAMQLSNIARDVGEDARNGRLYLPRDWMCEAGIDPEQWLTEPCYSRALASVVARLLEHADALYQRADVGIAGLPRECRFGITAARRIYAAIGHEVRRRACNSVDTRAVVPARRKAALLAGSVGWSRGATSRQVLAPLTECRFLIDAAVIDSPAALPVSSGSRVSRSVVALLDLFERLERRERAARAQLPMRSQA